MLITCRNCGTPLIIEDSLRIRLCVRCRMHRGLRLAMGQLRAFAHRLRRLPT